MIVSQEAIIKSITGKERSSHRIPVNCGDNFILHHKGFNYYAVDLRNSNFDDIEDIIAGCEAVENDTWKAQEDFFQYIRKSDILVYAEKNERIVGFNLISLLLINEYCFYTIDEAMVLRAFQGNNIARNVVITALWWFLKKIDLGSAVKKAVLVSISANPKVVNNYFKNKYVLRVFDTSFFPSDELITLHRAYLTKNNFFLVDNRFPFCVKNLFPGSQQLDWTNKKYQFHNEIVKRMPPEFDHKKRGDAWAFMLAGNLKLGYTVIRIMTFLFLGTKTLFNKNIGLLKSKKHLVSKPQLTRIRLIDGRFIERRNIDRRTIERRIADRRMINLGCDANGIDRRTSERRDGERRNLDRRLAR
ncbi:MAG: hypothetical protein JW807_02565 [Spirochaetes bacterium]|nr:hypothetical protein [Spirochaetota bacterium]